MLTPVRLVFLVILSVIKKFLVKKVVLVGKITSRIITVAHHYIKIIPISAFAHTHTHTPVSYTHLDVYKRQTQWADRCGLE